MEIYDVSLPISKSLPIYPGDPGVEMLQSSAIALGDNANVTLLHFGAHTGTHVDAPAHFIEGAEKVNALSLTTLIGKACVVKIPDTARAITANDIRELVPDGARRILFKTRNSQFWSEEKKGFRADYTYLTSGAARALVDQGVKLIGIDYLSVEEFESESFETHKVLLRNGIIIIEGLDLRHIPPGEYELICLPLKIAEGTGDGAPARTILRKIIE